MTRVEPEQSRGQPQVEIVGAWRDDFDQVLTSNALHFVATLAREFSAQLKTLLDARMRTGENLRAGFNPGFLSETESIRTGSWKVGPIPADLRTRRVEITGPVERKMMINALNSGADVYMADFEDSHSPTWVGTIQGQLNLRDAVRRRIEYSSPEGKKYSLGEKTATLCVRPRGLHLSESRVLVNSEPVPGSLFDFGLYLYHNSRLLLQNHTGPYFYIPKLENHLEARFWNDVFVRAEELLALPTATIKCSVLIETILAAFQMDEILYELRDRITALNFGRWDYIFSFIKKLGQRPEFVLPDRALLTMPTHFLKSSSLLLVETCHRRGAYAIGGMAPQVPIKNNPEVQALALEKVMADKKREVEEGYDGAWVAHPGLVPVVMKIFMNHSSSSKQPMDEKLAITAEDLLTVPTGASSEDGLRANVRVSLEYLESWLNGIGCVSINNLMEDTATVEISRAQIWQWIHHGVRLSNGKPTTVELFRQVLGEEMTRLEQNGGRSQRALGEAGKILDHIVTSRDFVDFMTIPALPSLEALN